MKRLLITCLAVGIASVAIADEVNIPNQFTAGTPALAADVNANFGAVELAVDDNAQRVVALETGLGTAGIAVRVGGAVVGRYVAHGTGFVEVDVAASVGVGTERVAEAVILRNTSRIIVISPLGYFFELLTGDLDHPFLLEGNVDTGFLFYDGVDCTGALYMPIEGTTGWFSTFTPGIGDVAPTKRWAARQGAVLASPDPNDTTPVYMIRRGAAVQTLALGSLLVFSTVINQPFCVNLGTIPGFDVNNPLHVNHTVVPLEANDPAVSGVSGLLGGEISVGL